MEFRLLLSTKAEDDLDARVEYLKGFDVRAAIRWLDRTLMEIETLKFMPHRFGLARENETAGRELRQLVVGRRRHSHRVIFQIVELRQEVRVYAVLASAQDDLTPSEIENATFPEEPPSTVN